MLFKDRFLSPRVKAVTADFFSLIEKEDPSVYPALKVKLAEILNVRCGHFAVTCGEKQSLDLILRLIVTKGNQVLTFPSADPLLKEEAHLNNFQITEGGEDFETFLFKTEKNTAAVYLTNPSVFDGRPVSHLQLKKLLKLIPERVFVIINESFYEFAEEDKIADSIALQATHPNLITIRSFSHTYKLPGISTSFVVAHPELIKVLEKHSLQQNAVSLFTATAALNDYTYYRSLFDKIKFERNYILKMLKGIDIKVPDSQADFIAIPSSEVTSEMSYKLRDRITFHEGYIHYHITNRNNSIEFLKVIKEEMADFLA
jgi:histidinol-phosphate aminotransferase